MKRFPWLMLSLLLNALLVLALGWAWRPPAMAKAGMSRATSPPPSPGVGLKVDSTASQSDPRLAEYASRAVDWSHFSVGDWTRYRDELIACGCPRRTVREIIEPLVHRSFLARSQPLIAEYSARFWEMVCPPAKARMEQWEQKFKQLDSERDSVLSQLFPEGWAGETRHTRAGPDERLSFLPIAQAERVLAAEKTRDDAVAEARNVQPDPQLQAELIQQAEAALEAELAGLLSPEQLAEFRARSSGNAWWIRRTGGVALAPGELAEITRIYDRERSGNGAQSPKAAEVRRAELQSLLGAERFEQFERAQDGTYGELLRMSDRTGLASAAVDELWQNQRAYRERAERIAQDAAVDRAARTAELTDLREQHERTVREFLSATPGAFEAWQRQQARWLKDTFSMPKEDPVGDWLKGL